MKWFRPWRVLRWLLYVCIFLGVGVFLLGNAEFKAPQLESRLKDALEDAAPGLIVEPEDVFVQIVPWTGEVRLRLANTTLTYPETFPKPILVESVQVALPFSRAMDRDFRPQKVWVSGADLTLRLPEIAAEVLPEPGGAESAEDYWGFVFHSTWLETVENFVPADVIDFASIENVKIRLQDPAGLQTFADLEVLKATERFLGHSRSGKGRRLLTIDANLQSTANEVTSLSISSDWNGGDRLTTTLKTGHLVPAQFYHLLRFLGLRTPERLTTAYRINASLDLNATDFYNAATVELYEGKGEEERLIALGDGFANALTQDFELKADFNAVQTTRIAPWTPVPQYMEEMDLRLTGRLEFSWARPTNDWLGEFWIADGRGALSIPSIGLPAQAGAAVGVQSLSAQGAFDSSGLALNNIEIQTGNQQNQGPRLRADLVARTAAGGPILTLDLRSDRLNHGDLFFLWPEVVARKTRNRVAQFVEAGAFSDLVFTGAYRLAPTDEGQTRFIVEGQQIAANFERGQVRITPRLPTFDEASGSLDLRARALEVSLNSAQFGPAEMTGGTTRLDFSTEDWLDISVNGPIAGPLSSSLAVLADGGIGLSNLRALPLSRMRGRATGNLGLRIGFNPSEIENGGINRDNVSIDTDLRITGLQVPDFIGSQDIEGGTLNLNIASDRLTGGGSVRYDGIDSQVNITQEFGRDRPPGLRVSANASVPTDKIRAYVPGMEAFLDGTATGEFVYRAAPGRDATLGIDLDLAQVAIDFPALVYQKSRGQSGSISMDLEFGDNGPTAANNIALSGPRLEARGSLNLRSSGWSEFSLSRAEVNRTSLRNIRIRNQSDQILASIGSGTFDIEPFLDQFTEGSSGGGGSSSGALGFGLQKPVVLNGAYFDRLRFDTDSNLRDVSLSLVAANNGIRGFDLNALVPSNEAGLVGGRLSSRLFRENGGYRLNFTAQNFGATLAALGMTDDVRGGSFSLSGASDSPLGGGSWVLRGLGSNIRVQELPAMVQVAAAISLTGILEQMSGTGLNISELEFRGTLAAPTLHVQRLKVAGPSLGLSTAGALNWSAGTMNFRGAIAPFNIVNMVLGEIPIISELFTGINGQGLFAAQFSVRGRFSGPQVQVDPLSLIQPGFLRNIIDGIEGQTY